MAILTFFVGDDELFEMQFLNSAGVAQTITSGVVSVFKNDGTNTVPETAAVISAGVTIQHQFNTLPEGQFKLYFKALIGTRDISKEIDFRVIAKDGVTD